MQQILVHYSRTATNNEADAEFTNQFTDHELQIDNPESPAQNRMNLESFMSHTEDQATPTQHVMRLLLENRLDEAAEYIEETLGTQITELEHQLMLLRKEQALLGQLTQLHRRREGQLSAGVVTAAQVGLPTSEDGLFDLGDPVEDVRHAIFSMCAELAQRSSGTLLLADAVEEMKRRGIDLKSTRPGTSIGNMLFKSADWTRLGDGLFKLNSYKN